MNCKTILVNLDIEGPVEPAVEAVRDLATHLQAMVIGLCAADARPPMVTTDGGALVVEVWQKERDEIKADIRKIRATFERLMAGFGHTEWREALDSPTRALTDLSRVADLVVMRASSGAATGDSTRTAAPSSVILQAGRRSWSWRAAGTGYRSARSWSPGRKRARRGAHWPMRYRCWRWPTK